MGKKVSPFVYWAQTEKNIFLKVDLKDVVEPSLTIEDEELEFEAVGVGAQGPEQRLYEFALEFYLPIEKESSSYLVTDREVKITLLKKDQDWWPRLLHQPHKHSWLKVDFDRWSSPDQGSSSNEEEEEDPLQMQTTTEMLKKKYPEAYKQLQKEEFGFIGESKRKVYLFCYNFFMFCGFLYVFSIVCLKYAKDQEEFLPVAYQSVGNVVKMLHLMMLLEILHPIFGYTKSSAFEALILVGGRNFVIFALIESEPRMQEKPVVLYLFFVYTLIELVRYPYYLLRVYDIEIRMISWLRYTLWIPLFPLGFICEGVIILRDIPYFEETGRFSVSLPNQWNFSFHFPTLLRVYLLLFFFPMLYTLMNHMYQLRCKKLGIKQHPKNKAKNAFFKTD